MDKRSIEIMRKNYRIARDAETELSTALGKAKSKFRDAQLEHEGALIHLRELEELAALSDVVLDPQALFSDAEARGELRIDCIEGRAHMIDPVTGQAVDMRDLDGLEVVARHIMDIRKESVEQADEVSEVTAKRRSR